jgi:DNA excision repair protein ERCC-4
METSNQIKEEKSVIEVTVNQRDTCKRLVEKLQEAGDTQINRERLVIGDYRLNELVVMRITLPNLVSSIKNRRLFLQAGKLRNLDGPAVIIIEGTVRDLQRSKIKRGSIQGALITLMLHFNIPVLRSISPEESAFLMLTAARQLERKRTSVKRNDNGRFRLKGADVSQLHLLQGIPGIGPHRAKKLLKRFGSLYNLFQASSEELSEIPGIGNKYSDRIISTIHKEVYPGNGEEPNSQ